MKQRGRKSAASLSVANAQTHLTQRPAPPPDLTALQRHHWVEISNCLPAEWFGDENKALLGEYCRTLTTLAFLNAQIDDQESKDDPEEVNYGKYLELLKRREALVRVALSQATKMRLTQQSRYRADAAATATSSPRPKRKPWDD